MKWELFWSIQLALLQQTGSLSFPFVFNFLPILSFFSVAVVDGCGGSGGAKDCIESKLFFLISVCYCFDVVFFPPSNLLPFRYQPKTFLVE